jgi:hypothetical protein
MSNSYIKLWAVFVYLINDGDLIHILSLLTSHLKLKGYNSRQNTPKNFIKELGLQILQYVFEQFVL